MGVPTIFLSYSQKAKGIAQDIYGCKDYLIDGKDITAERLCVAVKQILEHEDECRMRVRKQAQTMKELAFAAGTIVANLIAKK
jgi:polysaccharide pyruvyl transferase WcaK-like protein